MAEPMTPEDMIAVLRTIITAYPPDALPTGVHFHLQAMLADLKSMPTCVCGGMRPVAEIEVDGPRLSLMSPADVQAYFGTKGLPERYRLIVLPS